MITKVCSKCKIRKLSDKFTTDKRKADGLQSQCKECRAKYYLIPNRKWRKANPDYSKTYLKTYNKEYNELNPWVNTYRAIQGRCKYKYNGSYKSYGGKGIKCLITLNELEFLWKRDKAYKMRSPSIDRLNNKEHYTIDNCRYIELIDNKRKKRG